MSKKKILFIFLAALVLVSMMAAAVPAIAAGPARTQPAQDTPRAAGNNIVFRLLRLQDEAKVDAALARLVGSGRLAEERAVRVKDFWTEHHARFAKNAVLRRLLNAKDESRVRAYLDRMVANGRMSREQAERIIRVWEIIHTAPPGA